MNKLCSLARTGIYITEHCIGNVDNLPQGVNLSNRFRSDPSSLFAFLCSSWNLVAVAVLSATSGLSSEQTSSSTPWGTLGRSRVGRDIQSLQQVLGLDQHLRLEGGSTRRHPNQAVGPHRPAPPRCSRSGGSSPKSLRVSDLLILPAARPELNSGVHPATIILCWIVPSPRRNF